MSRVARSTRRAENEVEFSRIVAFSDGVFAIAITLLVLALDVPARLDGETLDEALWSQRKDLFAYALSFAVIGRFWIIHHRFFGDVERFDGRLLAMNLLYLSWLVLIPFSSEVLGDHGGEPAAVVLYAVNISAVTLVGLAMALDAHRAGFSSTEPGLIASHRRRALFTAVVFLTAVPLAFIDAEWAPLIWLALFFVPSQRRPDDRSDDA